MLIPCSIRYLYPLSSRCVCITPIQHPSRRFLSLHFHQHLLLVSRRPQQARPQESSHELLRHLPPNPPLPRHRVLPKDRPSQTLHPIKSTLRLPLSMVMSASLPSWTKQTSRYAILQDPYKPLRCLQTTRMIELICLADLQGV